MATLYVLRHAKSSWDEPALADSDRPLAPRGRKAAKRIGEHMQEAGVRPQLVLCSPATRAQQTVQRLGRAIADAELVVEPDLYTAGAGELEERIRRIPYWVETAMLVGHNPALQELVLGLARPGPMRDRAATKLPTGALARLELEGSWRTLHEGSAELVALVLPRELNDDRPRE
jgi:phosphohistidine phosphatase